MKRLFSTLVMIFTMNSAAAGLPSYENFEHIPYPDTQDYVEALVEDLKRTANCRLNGKRLPFTEVQTVFKVTIGDRLRLIYEKNDLSKLYFVEGYKPALLISTQHENSAKTKLFDELKFNLTEDSKSVTNIDFDQYIIKTVRVNEGTMRNPIMIQKEVLEHKLNIKCVL